MIYLANIYVPSDLDNRDDFVKSCYLRRKVALISRTFGVMYDCIVPTRLFGQLEFPNGGDNDTIFDKNIGSSVIFARNEKGSPVVLDVIPNRDELIDITEGEIEFSKVLNGCIFKIKGSAKDKKIDIAIDALEDTEINITASGEDSNINLSSKGEVNVESNKVNITAGEELNLNLKTSVLDSNISITENEIKLEENSGSKVTLKDGKITFNEGKNGEMINLSDLVVKLNDLVSTVNTHISKYNAHVHPVAALPNPTGITIPSAVTVSLATDASNFSENDFKDDNVIH